MSRPGELAYDFEPAWTSTQAVERLSAAVDDVARILDPSRPPLGEAERSFESEPTGDMGETDATATCIWPLLECSVNTTGINDGATPSSDSVQVIAHVDVEACTSPRGRSCGHRRTCSRPPGRSS